MKLLPALVLSALAFILMASSCRTFGVQDLDKMQAKIEFQKGACFGSCPVFKMVIYQGGLATYEGQRFTDRMGLHAKQLDGETYKELVKAFDAANIWNFQNTYKAQVPDLPTVTITYYKDDNVKTIKGKDGRPDKVVELEKMLNKVAESGGWQKQEEDSASNLPDNVIANELIVNLAQGTDANVWIIQYAKQDMQLVKRISPNSPYYLFKYDTNRMEPNKMLDMVRRSPDVVSAEFNKEVKANPRG